MSNIPTAEDFKNKEYGNIYWDENSAVDFAIEFAKLHVQAALKAASEKADMLDDKECWRNCSCEHPCKVVDKDSILNAYTLENIK